MTVKPNVYTLANSRKFFEKFGFGEISVEQFDLFIIDEKLASDPETSDTKDPRYRGFIAERAQAKNKLSRGGAHYDPPFSIEVIAAGRNYMVSTWSDNAIGVAKEVANRIDSYTKGRLNKMRTLHNRAEALSLDHPSDPELQSAQLVIGAMRTQAGYMQSRIKALVVQYNKMADMAEQEVQLVISQYDDAEKAAVPEENVALIGHESGEIPADVQEFMAENH